jgi:alanyl-tRNA synthetase
VQDRCNELIRAALPVTVHTFPSVSAALADASFVSRLPQHKVLGEELTGTVRVIEIEGVDMNPCGGTHLRRLSELQLVQLTRAEKVKGKARVYFLAGERAVRAGREAMAAGRELSGLLSSGVEGQADMVRKMQTELRALLKANTRLQRELADRIAQQLLASSSTSSSSSPQSALLLHHQPESSASFLSSIADAFGALLPASVSPSPLLFLTATENAEGKEGAWMLYGDRAAELAADVAKAMEGKGGGKGKKIQGKAARVDRRAEAVKLIQDKLAASSAQ